MKNLLLLNLLLMVLFTSCSDDAACKPADYIGTWVGTDECNIGVIKDVTISIVADGSDKLVIDGGIFSMNNFKVNDCSVEDKDIFSTDIGKDHSGNLSGDTLSLRFYSYGGVVGNITCNYDLTKQ